MVTSRLFPPGTIYASALTPVIVAAVSEMLRRPADRVAELRRQRRTLVMDARGVTTGATSLREREARLESMGRKRRIHPKVWLATGLTAFAVAVAALTLPELIFGGAVATSHRTTFFGGGKSNATKKTKTSTTEQKTAPTTVTQTVPAQTPPAATQTHTTTGTSTATTPAPLTPTTTDTGTTPTETTPPPTP